MMNKGKYDIVFLVDAGIGNVLEALYAVERCIDDQKRTGIFCGKLSPSFIKFLRKSYGPEVILDSLEGISTTHLVHSFTFQEDFDLAYEHYFYIQPDVVSSRHLSETEQYLSVVEALYGVGERKDTLKFLAENYSERVRKVVPEEKVILYPGCSAGFAVKKWPYFLELAEMIGPQRTMLIGGTEDLNYRYAYYYPKWLTRIVPQFTMNRRAFYTITKKLRLLKPHAHYTGMEKLDNAYFNVFEWEELVALFRRCKFFVGNDGGLMHLAACCGAKGKAIFGPSSMEKNRPYSRLMDSVALGLDCQPCSFRTKGVNYVPKMIACPHQIACLYSIGASEIFAKIPL